MGSEAHPLEQKKETRRLLHHRPVLGTELPQGFSVLSRLEGYVGQAPDQAQLGDTGGSS